MFYRAYKKQLLIFMSVTILATVFAATLRTTGGVSIQQFGLTDDRLVPSAYIR